MAPSLSPEFEKMLLAAGAGGVSGHDVLRLSAFFHAHPGAPTPWDEEHSSAAYLAYFLPLNYARLRAAFAEMARWIPPEAVAEIWDFGSGPGTTQWVLEDETWLSPRPLVALERAPEARRLHQRLAGLRRGAWHTEPAAAPAGRRPPAGALAVFSYSFIEMQADLPDLERFDHLLIVEPSTREAARQLQGWRETLLTKGFHLLAPCTHAGACPLLAHSERDWCHTRIGFKPPEWWLALEARLPMKNRSLTHSYLLASRTQPAPVWPRPTARVIGDTLEERGKTRQMICRGPEREFLSWLHRNGEPPRIPRGSLVVGVEDCELKGQELRVTPEVSLEWSGS